MTIEQAKDVRCLLYDSEIVKSQLNKIDNHSFWFWTSFNDIDEFLRPLCKIYLQNKLNLLNEVLANK